MFQLDLRQLVSFQDHEEVNVLRQAQAKVLAGDKDLIAQEIERTIQAYSTCLGLKTDFSWECLNLTLRNGDKSKKLTADLDRFDQTQEEFTAKEYLFVRAFFCWLASIHFYHGGKRPSLLIVDSLREEGYSFFWQLEDKQSMALNELVQRMIADQSLRVEIDSHLTELSLAVGQAVKFANGKIISASRECARFSGVVITAENLSRSLGLLSLGYYTWLIDVATARIAA